MLLLTNDGAFARAMEHPSTGWIRRYRVRIHGKITPEIITKLSEGVTIDGVRYGSVHVVLDKEQGTNSWLTVSLTEGKNREIRRLMDFFGFKVTRLIRVSYGPFQLGTLQEGEVDEITGKALKEQLGSKAVLDLPKRKHKKS